MIIGFLEKAEQLEMGRLEVAIHFGAPTVVGHARGIVPPVLLVIVKLVLADLAPGIVQVDVGGPQQVLTTQSISEKLATTIRAGKRPRKQLVIRTSLTGGLLVVVVVVVLVVLVVVVIIVVLVVAVRIALVIIVFRRIAIGIEPQQPPRCFPVMDNEGHGEKC